ncbi:LysR family transcriptional regulator [Pseudohalocynthiibacter aestuariivivens]|uniref:LysR family transcriptional regulator n=1 Tax=Pseudohalocynthiibacter aestuariivivens TaxID=1591409 RepID=A0ABV5JIN4_9RHOB|nr:LysR family transcriptional regulator [Pseudohalocynthiibacter aestuariivivens]MCK0101544.1 LysR family transcriptional regulator [Pseudohalocynthiibacter sp. F2068]
MKNWDDLRFFRALVGARSIRAAAADLQTTHATVSRRVRTLEEELGNTLFERGRDGFKLTEFGRKIQTFADAVADNTSAIDRLSFAQGGSLAGPLRLSLLEDLYTFALHDHIDEFMTQHPMIKLELITTAELSNLNRREADVVIRLTQSPPEYTYGRKVAESPLAVYASQSYLDNRPSLDRWIALDYAPTLAPYIPARPAFLSPSLSVVASVLRHGQGIGLLPCFIGEKDPDLRRLLEFDLIADLQIWVLTHQDLRHNPRVRALIEHLYSSFSQIRNVIEGTIPV